MLCGGLLFGFIPSNFPHQNDSLAGDVLRLNSTINKELNFRINGVNSLLETYELTSRVTTEISLGSEIK